MALIEIEEPSPRALRWFGLPVAAVVGVIAAVLATRGVALEAIAALLGGAAVVLAVYYALPRVRRPIYLAWMYAAYPLGFVLAHVVMALIYFLVVTPIGLLSRLLGRRSITRGFEPEAETYWEPRAPRDDPSTYFDQY